MTDGFGADSLSGQGTARFILYDILFSGPESTVPFTLNLQITGLAALDTLYSSTRDSFRDAARAESSVRLSGFFDFLPRDPEQPNFGGTLDRTVISYEGCEVAGCVETNVGSSGMFDGFAGDASALTPIFDAPVGRGARAGLDPRIPRGDRPACVDLRGPLPLPLVAGKQVRQRIEQRVRAVGAMREHRTQRNCSINARGLFLARNRGLRRL